MGSVLGDYFKFYPRLYRIRGSCSLGFDKMSAISFFTHFLRLTAKGRVGRRDVCLQPIMTKQFRENTIVRLRRVSIRRLCNAVVNDDFFQRANNSISPRLIETQFSSASIRIFYLNIVWLLLPSARSSCPISTPSTSTPPSPD